MRKFFCALFSCRCVTLATVCANFPCALSAGNGWPSIGFPRNLYRGSRPSFKRPPQQISSPIETQNLHHRAILLILPLRSRLHTKQSDVRITGSKAYKGHPPLPPIISRDVRPPLEIFTHRLLLRADKPCKTTCANISADEEVRGTESTRQIEGSMTAERGSL